MDNRFLIPPVLLALNEGLKAFGMPSKYAILIDWVLGIVLNVALMWDKQSYVLSGIEGFLIGSSAGGVYDGIKFLRTSPEIIGDTKKSAEGKK